MNRRWSCPNGQHPAILAPGRMRKKDVRRYCLDCSVASGLLTDRVVLSSKRRGEAKAAQRAEKRKAEAVGIREARRARIARLARFCGPAVVAKRMGIKRTTAAKRILAKYKPLLTSRSGGVPIWVVCALVDKHRFHYASGLQTVRQWRNTNPGATAILATTHHYIYLSSGRLVEDNGLKSSRAKVRAVIRFDTVASETLPPRRADSRKPELEESGG